MSKRENVKIISKMPRLVILPVAYSVTFDNTPYGDKSSDRSQLASELEDNNLAIANSSTVEINTDDSFMSVVQSVMCHTSSSYGFQICGHTEPLKTG
jgi:hypothetical protein